MPEEGRMKKVPWGRRRGVFSELERFPGNSWSHRSSWPDCLLRPNWERRRGES